MATYDFSLLESKFSEIVEKMADKFDSHEFILKLAQENQLEYVSALYAYAKNQEKPEPFQVVHGLLMHKLVKHTELVTLIRENKPSKDIFGNTNNCGEWQKVR